MDRESIKEFIRDLTENSNVEIVDHHEWVSTHCPFAPYLHPKGTDSNISFGIKIDQYGPSTYNCFTCKKRGSLKDLLEDIEHMTGDDYSGMRNGVEDLEYLGGSLPDYENRIAHNSKYAGIGEPVSTHYLDVYDEAYDHPYLATRGIGPKTAKILDLRVDYDNKGAQRILFPVFSHTGLFYGYTGRAVEDGVEPRVRDYFGLPKRHLLLGSHRANSDKYKFIVLVEGLFDYARLVEFDALALASMHSGLTNPQADILKFIGLPVYVMYDNDKAGQDGVKHVKKVLGKHLPLYKVRYPTGVKDPNGLSLQQYRYMIKDSRLL